MVFIPIQFSLVGFAIEFVSLFAELGLLKGALNVNLYFECRNLEKGKGLRIKTHRQRVRIIPTAALLVFIGLEALVSVNNNSVPQNIPSSDPCIATVFGNITDKVNVEAESIYSSCLVINGRSANVKMGNFSLRTGMIACEKEASYSYTIGGREEGLRSDGVLGCTEGVCAVTAWRDGKFLFSGLEPETPIHKTVNYWVTNVATDLSDMLPLLSRKAGQLYFEGSTDTEIVRRRLLTTWEKTTCPFEVDGKMGTDIPVAIIIIVVVSWVLSFVFFLSTLLLKKNIFYDMDNALDWAEKVVLEEGKKNENGDGIIRVQLKDKQHYIVSLTTAQGVTEQDLQKR